MGNFTFSAAKMSWLAVNCFTNLSADKAQLNLISYVLLYLVTPKSANLFLLSLINIDINPIVPNVTVKG